MDHWLWFCCYQNCPLQLDLTCDGAAYTVVGSGSGLFLVSEPKVTDHFGATVVVFRLVSVLYFLYRLQSIGHADQIL